MARRLTYGGVGVEPITTPDTELPTLAAAERERPAARAIVREHRVFLALLAARMALRVVTFLAYRPALLYQDSIFYLQNAGQLVPSVRFPIGYPVALRVLPLSQGLEVVPLVQHVLALLIAAGLYLLLLRLRIRPWVAAL